MNCPMVQRKSVGGFSGREFIFTKYPVTAGKLTHQGELGGCFITPCFVLFDLILLAITSHQQSFSYIGTDLPGLNQ